MKLLEDYILCGIVHRKLRSGEPITDEELLIGVRHYTRLVQMLETINEPSYRLFLDKIRSDLDILKRFKEARLSDKKEVFEIADPVLYGLSSRGL